MWFITIVLKNMLHRKIRTGLTVLAMGVAVCAVVTMVGISLKFEESLSGVFETRGVDIIVSRNSPQRLATTLDENLGARFANLAGVRSVDPLLVDVVSFENAKLVAVYVMGWLPEGAMFEDIRLMEGRTLRANEKLTALIGRSLAVSLGKKMGDDVEIEGSNFKIVGVYESYNMFENSMAIVDLRELQRLMDRSGRVTTFLLRVERNSDKKPIVDRLCREIEGMKEANGRPLGVTALPTQDHVKSNLELRVARAMAWITAFVALLIGVIGMLNTMMISVFERTREIGMLRAMGWRQRRILFMILLESLIICAAGSIFGLISSVVLTNLLSRVEAASIFINGTVGPMIMTMGVIMAFSAGLAGSIVPALRASRLLPTEALRHE